jgi:hypothetical protein
MLRYVLLFIAVLLFASPGPVDRLVKRADNNTVYIQHDNVLYAIPNAHTFECMGLKWERIDVLSDKEWSRLSVGSRLASLEDNALIKGSGKEVYLVSNCQRRFIPDPATFDSLHLSWNAIQTTPDWMFKLVKEGEPYPSVSAAPVSGKGADPKEKARKVECAFSRPHMVLDNRVDHPVTFHLNGNFSPEGNPEGKCDNVRWDNGVATITVAAKSECKVILSKDEGSIINRVEVIDGRTYASDGNWDVFACCRHTPARQDAASSPLLPATGSVSAGSSPGSPKGGWSAALNDAIRSDQYNGTAWRAYRAAYDRQGLNVWTRDKDSNIPFSARTGWESLEFQVGTCNENK